MNKTAERLKKKLEKEQSELLFELQELKELSKRNLEFNLADLVDIGYLLRELATIKENLRKEINRTLKQVDKTIGIKITQKNMEDPNNITDSAKGELASGKVRVTQQPVLPKRDTEEHKALLAELGITDPLNVVAFHWPSMTETLTQNLEAGGNGFKSLDMSKVFKEIKVTYRTRTVKPRN